MEDPFHRPLPQTDDGRRRYSVLERYNRLTHGRRQRPDQHRREAQLASTTRSLQDNLYSGDLPSPGVSLHLSTRAQSQLRHSGETEDNDFPLVSKSDAYSSDGDSDDELDLFDLNRGWLTAIPPTSLGPWDVRYHDSSDVSSDDEERLTEVSPFQSHRPSIIPPIREEMPMTEPEGSQVPSDEALVELARNGQFAELWSELKMARQRQIEAGPSNGTVYYSAGDTFISEWTTFTSRRGLIIKANNSYRTAVDISMGSSFETCETYYENDSNAEVYRQASQETADTARSERQQQLRQLILDRGQQQCNRPEGRRRRVVAITRLPKQTQMSIITLGRPLDLIAMFRPVSGWARRQMDMSVTGAVAVIKRLRQALQVHRVAADDASMFG